MERKTYSINNDFYNELGESWYTRKDHPIALLRAENRVRVPWIIGEIGENKKVLDIGCGAGILTNALGQKGHEVYGIDVSKSSLQVAKAFDTTQKVNYLEANAYCLPFDDQMFDVVCAMDVLEHVEDPLLLISEAARTLKPGGLFFFHTFNRNLLSYLLVIKGVDWCVPNAPKNMHVYSLFITPEELNDMCHKAKLKMIEMRGFVPQIFSWSALKMLLSRNISDNFNFYFTKSLKTGYCGYARKEEETTWQRSH